MAEAQAWKGERDREGVAQARERTTPTGEGREVASSASLSQEPGTCEAKRLSSPARLHIEVVTPGGDLATATLEDVHDRAGVHPFSIECGPFYRLLHRDIV